MGIVAQSPIGIFDSGIGGLTVAKEVKKMLPNEQIVYFGDTAHLPYGDKSTAAIQAYAVKIADVLIKENCKLILIACNSASAAAFEQTEKEALAKALAELSALREEHDTHLTRANALAAEVRFFYYYHARCMHV
jgi:glutamate racemase